MTGRDDFSELIRAFLDGEVTPEEQALVEERLVDNAEDRRLFEEMRAMRNGLQSLPCRELDRDLSETVLRRAERAMLVNEPPPADDDAAARQPEAADQKPSAAAIVATKPMPPEPASWRPLIWFGVTVAAALLLMTMAGPWLRNDREVARDTTAESRGFAPASPDTSRRPSTADDETNAASRRTAVTAAKTDDFDADKAATDGVRYRRKVLPRAEELAEAGTTEQFGGRPALGPGSGSGTDFDVGQKNKQGEAAPTPPLVNRPETELAAASTMDRHGSEAPPDSTDRLQLPTDRMVLVRLDLSQQARLAASFDRSLSRNDIYYSSAEQQLWNVRQAFDERAKEVGKLAEGVDLNDFEGRGNSLDMLARADAGQTQLVYIETPETNFRALLEDLERQPDSIQIVGVDSGPEDAEWKGVAKTLAWAKRKASRGRASNTDELSSAEKSLADARDEIMEELEKEAAPPAAAILPPSKPAGSPSARKPAMDPNAAPEGAAETDFGAADAPAPAADSPALPSVREVVGEAAAEPAPAAPPDEQPFGSQAGRSKPDDAGADDPSGEDLLEEAEAGVPGDESMDLAGALQEPRGGGEPRRTRSDAEDEANRGTERELEESIQGFGGVAGGAVPGKAPASGEDKKRALATNAVRQTREEDESVAEGQATQTKSTRDADGAVDAEMDDAFGAAPGSEFRQQDHGVVTKPAEDADAPPSFAQRVPMPQRGVRKESPKSELWEDPAKVEKKAASSGGFHSRDSAAGGTGPPAPGAMTPGPARRKDAGYAFSFRQPTDGRAASSEPEKMVRVLFVIRTAGPIADLAADVPAEEPLASEVDAAAEPPAAAMEAAEMPADAAEAAEP